MPKAVKIENQIYMALKSLESLNEDTIEFKNQITTLFSQITQKHKNRKIKINLKNELIKITELVKLTKLKIDQTTQIISQLEKEKLAAIEESEIKKLKNSTNKTLKPKSSTHF